MHLFTHCNAQQKMCNITVKRYIIVCNELVELRLILSFSNTFERLRKFKNKLVSFFFEKPHKFIDFAMNVKLKKGMLVIVRIEFQSSCDPKMFKRMRTCLVHRSDMYNIDYVLQTLLTTDPVSK